MKKSLILLVLALPLIACDTLADLNPFEKKQEPLPGQRNPVFPNGIQVDRTIPQPFNPSAPIDAPQPATPAKKKQ
jgi:hypothetical protein